MEVQSVITSTFSTSVFGIPALCRHILSHDSINKKFVQVLKIVQFLMFSKLGVRMDETLVPLLPQNEEENEEIEEPIILIESGTTLLLKRMLSNFSYVSIYRNM